MFNGYVIHNNQVVGFNSGDDHHKIDGLKVEEFSMRVFCDRPDEVDALIDYLEILKLTLKG